MFTIISTYTYVTNKNIFFHIWPGTTVTYRASDLLFWPWIDCCPRCNNFHSPEIEMWWSFWEKRFLCAELIPYILYFIKNSVVSRLNWFCWIDWGVPAPSLIIYIYMYTIFLLYRKIIILLSARFFNIMHLKNVKLSTLYCCCPKMYTRVV